MIRRIVVRAVIVVVIIRSMNIIFGGLWKEF